MDENDIDLERIISDPEYRRKILRRLRHERHDVQWPRPAGKPAGTPKPRGKAVAAKRPGGKGRDGRT